jgi:hypothetical protein
MSRVGAWARWVRGRLRARPPPATAEERDARDLAALREDFGMGWMIAHMPDGTWKAVPRSATHPIVTTWAATTLRATLEEHERGGNR